MKTVYCGIGPNAGLVIPEEDALPYAMHQCGIPCINPAPDSEEFKGMLVEWFYSGSWLENGQEE
jgi:hypothetical protein